MRAVHVDCNFATVYLPVNQHIAVLVDCNSFKVDKENLLPFCEKNYNTTKGNPTTPLVFYYFMNYKFNMRCWFSQNNKEKVSTARNFTGTLIKPEHSNESIRSLGGRNMN